MHESRSIILEHFLPNLTSCSNKIEGKLTTYLPCTYYVSLKEVIASQQARKSYFLKIAEHTNFSPCWPPYWKYPLVLYIAGSVISLKFGFSLPVKVTNLRLANFCCHLFRIYWKQSSDLADFKHLLRLGYYQYANYVSTRFSCGKYVHFQINFCLYVL